MQAQVAQQLYGQALYAAAFNEPKKRIRQDSKPLLNGLETEFLGYLRNDCPVSDIYPQSLRFKLGNGVWYKPDFVQRLDGQEFTAFEVKGPHAFRGGMENLKVAAHKYPWMRWKLAWKAAETGQWIIQDVLP